MKFDYTGKTVWITGASSGIGKALALEAAARGARLVLSARRRELLLELAATCAPAPCEVLDFDLMDPDSRASACGRFLADDSLGLPDIVILNAGRSQRSTFIETPPEAFDAIMALDFGAQVDLVRRLLPAMITRGSGSLVAVSSIAGLAGAPLRPAYSAAKHALAGFFQSLRSELEGSGIRVVTVYPGYVRTGIAREALGPGGVTLGRDDPHIEHGADPVPVARSILRAALGGPVERKLAFDLKSRFGLFLSRRLPGAWARLSARHADIGDRGHRAASPELSRS